MSDDAKHPDPQPATVWVICKADGKPMPFASPEVSESSAWTRFFIGRVSKTRQRNVEFVEGRRLLRRRVHPDAEREDDMTDHYSPLNPNPIHRRMCGIISPRGVWQTYAMGYEPDVCWERFTAGGKTQQQAEAEGFRCVPCLVELDAETAAAWGITEKD